MKLLFTVKNAGTDKDYRKSHTEQYQSTFDRFLYDLLGSPCIVIKIGNAYSSMRRYLGTWCVYFKRSASDSTDKEGRMKTVLKSVARCFFFRLFSYLRFLFFESFHSQTVGG